MLNNLKTRKKEPKDIISAKQSGFTIIEVLIVLAIAGLILLIVFLAVPALQRNSRNTQRKDDAAHLAGLISEYESNTGGAVITSSSLTSATSGQTFAIITTPTSVSVATTAIGSATAPAPDTVAVYTSATCNGTSPAYSASTRAGAVVYGLEGSVTKGCVSI